jgi:glycosyltransferase involved in cell wall biosynthesis
MIRVCHPTVNAYTRNTVQALAEVGELECFQTTLGWNAGALPDWLPGRLRAQLARRQLPVNIGARLQRHPFLELGRLLAGAARLSGWSADEVYQDFDAWCAGQLRQGAGQSDAVFCGEDAALATFNQAHQAGVRRFYDLPIAHHQALRRLLAEEARRLPAFAGTLQGAADSPAKLARKDAEIALADVLVVCSDFVRDTLLMAGVEASKIRVVRYGAPEGLQAREPDADRGRPLRVLFAGAVTQRKGIGDLLEAMRRLGRRDVECVIMGALMDGGKSLGPYRDYFHYEAPRPHAQVLQLMRSCDVLVLPSIVEGFALVIAEAMACGLPVVVTPNTGAAGWIEDGRDGFLVPVGQPEVLADRIRLLADDRDLLARMSEAAVRKAASRPWSRYRQELREVLFAPPA